MPRPVGCVISCMQHVRPCWREKWKKSTKNKHSVEIPAACPPFTACPRVRRQRGVMELAAADGPAEHAAEARRQQRQARMAQRQPEPPEPEPEPELRQGAGGDSSSDSEEVRGPQTTLPRARLRPRVPACSRARAAGRRTSTRPRRATHPCCVGRTARRRRARGRGGRRRRRAGRRSACWPCSTRTTCAASRRTGRKAPRPPPRPPALPPRPTLTGPRPSRRAARRREARQQAARWRVAAPRLPSRSLTRRRAVTIPRPRHPPRRPPQPNQQQRRAPLQPGRLRSRPRRCRRTTCGRRWLGSRRRPKARGPPGLAALRMGLSSWKRSWLGCSSEHVQKIEDGQVNEDVQRRRHGCSSWRSGTNMVKPRCW